MGGAEPGPADAPNLKRARACCYAPPPNLAEVVDHRQDAESAAIAELIADVVERLTLVRPLRQSERSPCSQRSFAAAAPADLEPLFPIQASQLLVVHTHPLATKQDEQAPVAEPATLGGKFAQTAA